MSVLVKIPTLLRKITSEQDKVTGDGANLGEVITTLDQQYPGLKERIFDESGELRRFVNVFVNGEDVRFLSGLQTPLKSGDEISIVPAVAGGAKPLPGLP
ncbi:MAG: ubiquitin-like small modifier protein 1 [Dehalococcoidia bacterium]